MKKKGVQRSRFRYLWLPVVLALGLGILWLNEIAFFPTPLYLEEYDPQMPYFLNSLSTFKSEPYNYFDHPGTPVELLGTFVIALIRVGVGFRSETFITYLLNNPNVFLAGASFFITLASMGLMIALGRHSISIEGFDDALKAAGVAVLFFVVMTPFSYSTIVKWSHDSFNYAIGMLLLFALYSALTSKLNLTLMHAAALGLGAGLLAAIQLYFITWVLGILISVVTYSILAKKDLMGGLLSGVVIIIASVCGFIVSTLPIMHRYRELTWWVKGIIFHQGKYGTGETGITSFTQITHNFQELFSNAPLIYIASLILLILLGISAWRIRATLRNRPGWVSLALGFSIQILTAHLIILKHPGTSYLLSVAAILPFVFALIIAADKDAARPMNRFLSIIAVLLIGAFVLGVGRAMTSRREKSQLLGQVVLEGEGIVERASAEMELSRDSLTILWGFGTVSKCFALRFGDIYTGGVFQEELNTLCPNDWMYDVWSGAAILPGGPQSLISSEEWDLLVTLGSPFSEEIEPGMIFADSAFGDIRYFWRTNER